MLFKRRVMTSDVWWDESSGLGWNFVEFWFYFCQNPCSFDNYSKGCYPPWRGGCHDIFQLNLNFTSNVFSIKLYFTLFLSHFFHHTISKVSPKLLRESSHKMQPLPLLIELDSFVKIWSNKNTQLRLMDGDRVKIFSWEKRTNFVLIDI